MVFQSKPWASVGILLCGLWLLAEPWLLPINSPSLGRSDLITGAWLVLLALTAFKFKTFWIQWLVAGAGIWLLMAPLVFWAPSPSSYISNTLVGTLVLVFSLLATYSQETGGEEVPPGWSYNPSAWSQRIPIVAIGLGAFFIAAYMAGYQLEYFKTVWDPFFGDGTHKVLTSEVSKAFPVSDAGLGAVTYLIEALSGLVGDRRRWRTTPWAVLLFGFLVIPAGVVSIVLVILQPWSVGAWCALCLLSALLCLITIPPAIDEVVASAGFLIRAKKEGRPLWQALFLGDVRPKESVQTAPTSHPSESFGFAMPWNLVLSTILGAWLLFAPSVLTFSGHLANAHYVLGALIVTFAVMAMAEAGRSSRWMNVVWGGAILLMPWIFDSQQSLILTTDILVGLAVIALAIPRGKIKERFGAWSPYIV